MGWRSGVRNNMDDKRHAPNKDEPYIPFAILICMLVMSLTFVIVIPVLGIMYMDMHNATTAAVHEVKKIRELRRQIIFERKE